MHMKDVDIVISGGGIAGLSAAAAFGTAGFSVICVDPTAPITTRDAEGADLRSTALLQPARDVLTDAGVWDLLAPYGMPLEIMRIIDAGGAEPEARVTQDFRASDVSDLPFGWNFPNWLLRRELLNRLAALDCVDFRPCVSTQSLFTRTASAKVRFSDGTGANARLVIGADGRNSPVRTAAGITVTTKRYGQKALAFAVTHPIPHDNVSTEIHRSGGPFTLVPLPDFEGQPSSAVVWMEDSARAAELAALDIAAFESEMSIRSCHVLGPLTLASRRSLWPIIAQHAKQMTAERVALMAEAAHVLPPIGAQGLNMSLRDLSTLLELALAAPDNLGSAAMLAQYHKRRYHDISMRVRGIDLLNRASQAEAQPLRDARALGLQAIYALPAVRRTLMQMGLGVR